MSVAAIILAAGQGTRMKSDRAKVLHPVCEEPMVGFPIRLSRAVGANPVVLVVGHQADVVEAEIRGRFPEDESSLKFALQAEQNGTGHAVMMGMKPLEGFEGHVLILYGDVPLLKQATIEALVNSLRDSGEVLSIVTTILDDPTGYGRVIRDDVGKIQEIVEQKDADESQRKIQEGNAGIYLVKSDFLRGALSRLSNDNAQGEYYLTDIVAFAIADGHTVQSVVAEDAVEVSGANNRAQLADLDRAMRHRINTAHMLAGVTLVDPETTYIGPDVTIGQDTFIQPNVHLRGKTTIGKNVKVDTGTVMIDAKVADGVTINPYSMIQEATVHDNADIGPYARLRPGAQIMDGAKVGNFVELKKTTLGKGAKANHLAYLGDSEVGPGANVGAGTITCNYDGYGKYKTKIGEGAFIGSNSTLVAPVDIGNGAYVAAGSTLTDGVGDDDLAFGRARQTNKAGRAKPLREAAKAKAAAEKAKKAQKKENV